MADVSLTRPTIFTAMPKAAEMPRSSAADDALAARAGEENG
ncbi:MAG TPA: hypothetical protein VNJ49_10645 [Bradyrhizobium sp.]|nr:hypothetical protein [Bradyrhizobium sp.]